MPDHQWKQNGVELFWFFAYCFYLPGFSGYGKKKVWDGEGIIIEKDASDSVLRLAGILALLLVLFSWNLQTIIHLFTPGTPENERVSAMWKDVQSGLRDNFAALQSSTSLTGSYSGGMSLGNQAPIKQDPAFQVKILAGPSQPARYYWRIRIYEEYIDGRWKAAKTLNLDSKGMDSTELDQSPLYTGVAAQYIWQGADGTIIPYAGRFSNVDIPYHLESSEGTSLVTGDGILYPQAPLSTDSLFILKSAVFSGSQNDLRNIPYSIPPQVASTYLQIPASLPKRVIDLAARTAVGDTVYSRVMAVNDTCDLD